MVEIGGWVPFGYTNENGDIPFHYRRFVQEAPPGGNHVRTELNVRDSDATLIIQSGRGSTSAGGMATTSSPGTLLTRQFAEHYGRPYLCLELLDNDDEKENLVVVTEKWLQKLSANDTSRIVLNVAGPRASQDASVFDKAKAFLQSLLTALS